MRTQITAESVENASSQFWEQMLGMSLTRVLKGTVSDSALDRRHVLGSCELTGVWNGRIEVRISMGLALHATAAMLMQSPGQVQPEDMLDAAREIANMIAGTIKSALPRPCAMSVPSAEIADRQVGSPTRAAGLLSVFFRHSEGTFQVSVCEESPLARPEISVGWLIPATAMA